MQASNVPTKSAVPFANSGTKNTIPVASQIGITPGLASFTDGFPPLTMTPIAAGGVPPYGADFNGILNFLSAATRWAQAGGNYAYDGAFSSAVGGYPKGSVILNATATGLWMSTADNNTTNPDTGGANWANPLAGRLLRTSVYAIVSGTQMVSINGGAFTSAGAVTFTPIAGTSAVEIEVLGAGGGSGGCAATGAGQVAVSTGGGAGAYAKAWLASGFSGAVVSVGSGGAAATAGGNSGSPGGASSFGALVTSPGGAGGRGGFAASSGITAASGSSAAPSGGNLISFVGATSSTGIIVGSNTLVPSAGGSSNLGVGGAGPSSTGVVNLSSGYGSGASGANLSASSAAVAGGVGGSGCVIVREYA